MYENLPDDIQQMLNTLVDDNSLKNESFLFISKKPSRSFKRCFLEATILENPEYTAEELYIWCLNHWAYSQYEAEDLYNSKSGELIGTIKDELEQTICMYKIGSSKEFKYVLMFEDKRSIISYINISLAHKKLKINNLWHTHLGCDYEYIKLFLKEWFIPKYALNVTSEEVDKLLKEVK